MTAAWTLRRLNLDTSWWLDLAGDAVVFDPWLIGSEVDFAPWFNEQWHTGAALPLDAVPAHRAVIVSQGYSDHLHLETLAAWPPGAPCVVVPEAARAVASLGRTVHVLPSWGEAPLRIGGLRMWRLTRPWWHPPRYHAVILADDAGRAAVHAPHGLPAAIAAEVGAALAVEVLAITWVGYRLPLWLGGAVNPGPDAAASAVAAMRARRVLSVHDEPRRASGLVSRLAVIERRPLPGAPWLDVGDLEPVSWTPGGAAITPS